MTLRMKGSQNGLKYALNLNQIFSISNKNEKKTGEEKYLEYCLGIGLPMRNSFFMANFASKLHHTLPQERLFNQKDIIKGLMQTMSYYRATSNSIYDPTKMDKSVSEVEAIIEAKQKEYIEICKKKEVLDKKARWRSKAVLTLGSSIIIAEFAGIMAGTFLYLSWDIMEPISYVMMLGNFTFGMLFYAKYKEELELSTLQDMIAGSFAKGLYRRKGIDTAKLEALEREIRENQEILSKSIY